MALAKWAAYEWLISRSIPSPPVSLASGSFHPLTSVGSPSNQRTVAGVRAVIGEHVAPEPGDLSVPRCG